MTNKTTKTQLKESLTEVKQILASTRRLTRRVIYGLILVVLAVVLLILGVMFLIERFTDVVENSSTYTWVFCAVSVGVGCIVGTVLSFLYSKLIRRAINPYLNALQHISEGDYNTYIAEDGLLLQGTHIADKFNQMAKRLASVETLSENFISDFSHELKTPIVSISGFAKLLKSDNLTDEERNEYLDVIINESERLVNLSQSVLLLTRLEDHVVEKTIFWLDEQLRKSVLLFDKTLKDKNIQLDLTAEKLPVYSSQQLLSHVWVNLIGNAIKFSPAGSTISVKAEDCGDYISVSVCDQGCGMDEETQENIFNKFYQEDKSRSVEGNGLGLPIVKKVLKLVDGKILVQSEPGKGSTFTVLLPNDKAKN